MIAATIAAIAQAPNGEWIGVPFGTTLGGREHPRMVVKSFRRIGPDLDVEDDLGRVWRFTDVAFSGARRAARGNAKRPSVTWLGWIP